MKQFASMICAVSLVVCLHAQSKNLFISTGKTTSLIFPYSIKHVDRGSKDVLVEPVRQADNILLVKAACKDFPETNLSVVTSDGSVYSFPVSYGETSKWIYRFSPQLKSPVSFYANNILDNPKTVKGVKDKSWNMIAQVSGIYIKDDVMYYQLQLKNQSTINYAIDFLRFFIKDKKQAKRTALQEIELAPLYVAGNTSEVKAGLSSTVVVVLDKFTIPDQKYLAIEIGEKNGGRNLHLKLGNNKIIKALPLSNQ